MGVFFLEIFVSATSDSSTNSTTLGGRWFLSFHFGSIKHIDVSQLILASTSPMLTTKQAKQAKTAIILLIAPAQCAKQNWLSFNANLMPLNKYGMFLVAILALTLPLPDGTLIYLEHSNGIVERYSNSSITHVGMVANENGQCWIYEATQPCVRRWTLDDYCRAVEDERSRHKDIKLVIMTPKKLLSIDESRMMKAYLDSILGIPYSIYSYVNGSPSNGLHCGELVATALNRTRRYKFGNPCRVLPVDIYNKTKGDYNRIH